MNASQPDTFAVLMPLVGVVVGGTIAASSAYTVGLLSDRRKQRMEHLRLRMQKIEETYLAVRRIQEDAIASFGHGISLVRWGKDLPKREADLTTAIRQLNMLLSVHFPELRPLSSKLATARGTAARALLEISLEPESHGKPKVPNPEATGKALAALFEEVLDICIEIEQRLQDIADEQRNA